MLLVAGEGNADRGALSVDLAAGGSFVSVPAPAPSSPRSTLSGSACVLLGARYALSNVWELSAVGFFEPDVVVNHNDVGVPDKDAVYQGTLVHRFSRLGALGGLRAVHGMVFRLHVGLELGWAQQRSTGLHFYDESVSGASPFERSLQLKDALVDGLAVGSLVGIEWVGGDSWSVALLPRLQLLPVHSLSWAVTVPLQVSWSWYL